MHQLSQKPEHKKNWIIANNMEQSKYREEIEKNLRKHKLAVKVYSGLMLFSIAFYGGIAYVLVNAL